jgi:hypothetical protein
MEEGRPMLTHDFKESRGIRSTTSSIPFSSITITFYLNASMGIIQGEILLTVIRFNAFVLDKPNKPDKPQGQ